MEEQKMELRLINPNESEFLKHIEWNADEIRQRVQEMMAEYKNVIYTEDSMKTAKADRATLNKFKKVIEDKRKEVKRRCMEPYEAFEKEIKGILQLIEEPISLIDSQIKGYEEAEKEKKRKLLEESYRAEIGDMAEILPFEKVFDPRFLNQSVSAKKGAETIAMTISRVRSDLETIDGLDSKYKLNAKYVYIKTLDLSAAIAEERRLRELEERLEAQRREREEAERRRLEEEAARKREQEEREEAERLAREKAAAEARAAAEAAEAEQESVQEDPEPEAAPAQEEDPGRPDSGDPGEEPQAGEEAPAEQAEPEEPKNQDEPEEAPPVIQAEKKYKATFCVIGTLDQIKALRSYMLENGIEFGKVEK